MLTELSEFRIGTLYLNEEIYRGLAVGNAGGVRVKRDSAGLTERIVVLTSESHARQASENPYFDRIEGDTLIYTGAGREGHQTIAGANARVVEQANIPFPIFGFKQVGSRRDANYSNKRWQFLGLLEYLRCYQEKQLDVNRESRSTWIFELRVLTGIPLVTRATAGGLMAELFSQRLPDMEQEREVVSPLVPGEIQQGIAEYALLKSVRERLLSFEPRQFEYFRRDLLQRSGFQGVEVTKYSQDGGIDVNALPALNSWPIRNLLIQLQAKRWLHTVGRKEVAELRGSLQPHAAGCIVTTSHFSRAAVIEAASPGKVPINLIDGYELASIANSLGLGLL